VTNYETTREKRGLQDRFFLGSDIYRQSEPKYSNKEIICRASGCADGFKL
jgi:hypothetical protein